jgi:hypothetical protein
LRGTHDPIQKRARSNTCASSPLSTHTILSKSSPHLQVDCSCMAASIPCRHEKTGSCQCGARKLKKRESTMEISLRIGGAEHADTEAILPRHRRVLVRQRGCEELHVPGHSPSSSMASPFTQPKSLPRVKGRRKKRQGRCAQLPSQPSQGLHTSKIKRAVDRGAVNRGTGSCLECGGTLLTFELCPVKLGSKPTHGFSLCV